MCKATGLDEVSSRVNANEEEQPLKGRHSNVIMWERERRRLRSSHEVRGQQDNGCPGGQGMHFREEGEIEGVRCYR